MLHFHKMKVVLKQRATLQSNNVLTGQKISSIKGLAILEKCKRCNKLQAYLVDNMGIWHERLVEAIFSDEEIQGALK